MPRLQISVSEELNAHLERRAKEIGASLSSTAAVLLDTALRLGGPESEKAILVDGNDKIVAERPLVISLPADQIEKIEPVLLAPQTGTRVEVERDEDETSIDQLRELAEKAKATPKEKRRAARKPRATRTINKKADPRLYPDLAVDESAEAGETTLIHMRKDRPAIQCSSRALVWGKCPTCGYTP